MSISEFLSNIDENFSCQNSIVLRYRKFITRLLRDEKIFIDEDMLQETSILEGTKTYPLILYKDVNISILDETSQMASGTFKSLDGCISIAVAKSQGAGEFVFESGGNTGTAFSIYAANLRFRTYFVVPIENIKLLSAKAFIKPYNYIVAVEDSQKVKEVSAAIEKITSAYKIPRLEWRYVSAMFRGCRILEYLIEGKPIDWFSQTISGGFGPIGIYKILNNCGKQLHNIPKFLGIQQAENCPYYNKIKGINTQAKVSSTRDLLIPIMYDSSPFSYRAFDDFKKIVDYNGQMLTVNRTEFNEFIEKDFRGKPIFELLKEKGTFIYRENGQVIDKAGLVGLAGVCKAIDLGLIKEGENVLHCLSSGTFQNKGALNPDFIINDEESIGSQLELFFRGIEDNKIYARQ